MSLLGDVAGRIERRVLLFNSRRLDVKGRVVLVGEVFGVVLTIAVFGLLFFCTFVFRGLIEGGVLVGGVTLGVSVFFFVIGLLYWKLAIVSKLASVVVYLLLLGAVFAFLYLGYWSGTMFYTLPLFLPMLFIFWKKWWGVGFMILVVGMNLLFSFLPRFEFDYRTDGFFLGVWFFVVLFALIGGYLVVSLRIQIAESLSKNKLVAELRTQLRGEEQRVNDAVEELEKKTSELEKVRLEKEEG